MLSNKFVLAAAILGAVAIGESPLERESSQLTLRQAPSCGSDAGGCPAVLPDMTQASADRFFAMLTVH